MLSDTIYFYKLFVQIFINTLLLYKSFFHQAMSLSPTSASFPSWEVIPFPLNFDVYLFNWTNPEKFHDTSTKPHFQELGPYRFLEISKKVKINWHSHNHSVSFRRKNFYHFDQEGSRGHLDDKITTVNIVGYVSNKSCDFLNSIP